MTPPHEQNYQTNCPRTNGAPGLDPSPCPRQARNYQTNCPLRGPHSRRCHSAIRNPQSAFPAARPRLPAGSQFRTTSRFAGRVSPARNGPNLLRYVAVNCAIAACSPDRSRTANLERTNLRIELPAAARALVARAPIRQARGCQPGMTATAEVPNPLRYVALCCAIPATPAPRRPPGPVSRGAMAAMFNARSQAGTGSIAVTEFWSRLAVALRIFHQVTGRVLDAGCGTGEHALFFAARSHPIPFMGCAPNSLAIDCEVDSTARSAAAP